MWPFIITFGFMSNITNIIVFLKIGVKDNVSTLLFSLSISDLTYLILITPKMCGLFIVAHAADYPWPFDQYLLYILPYWPAVTVYDISSFISVSLGVLRCACVAMPLKFKLVFTKSRTIKWILFLVVLAVALRIPVLMIFKVSFRTDPVTNVSVAYLAAIPTFKTMLQINDTINRGGVIYVNYIIMVACIFILSSKLFKASKIRQSVTAQVPQCSGSTGEKESKQSQYQAKDLQSLDRGTLGALHTLVGLG
ncbi:hypothetical protein EGW08_013776 [Elysia chlorotica]|uniref:G-protein coupled receptors family 1 profile domain-containing protein n=1 Tax=Elysia chlorotica TaxID=188477 RepID=A0A3S1B2P3_ELYCH|nr:hypothetical protein EGW08_013776 [Elysia chlorotica]